jgi:hypothetical protein
LTYCCRKDIPGNKLQGYFAKPAFVGIGTGLAAVAGTITGLVAVGFAAAATAPVWLTVAATVIVAAGIGIVCTNLGVNDWLKAGLIT